MNKDWSELIEEYLTGKLNDQEVEEFEKECQKNPDLKALLEKEKGIHDVIKTAGREDLIRVFELEEEQLNSVKSRMTPKHWIGIAAMLVIALGIITYLNSSQTLVGEDLYAEYYSTYPSPSSSRNDSSSFAWEKAITEYKDKNFQRAMQHMDNARESVPVYKYSFYKAVCLLELEQTVEAEILFKAVLTSRNEFNAQSKWYLGLIAIKNESWDSAIDYFESLKTEGEYKQKEVKEILRSIN